MNWKKTARLAALTVGGYLIAAFPASAQQVKIGIVNSFSGFLAGPGDLMQKGMDLYAKTHMQDLPAGVTIEVALLVRKGIEPVVAVAAMERHQRVA